MVTADFEPFATSLVTALLLARRRWGNYRIITDEALAKSPHLDMSMVISTSPLTNAGEISDCSSVSTSSFAARARSLMSKRQKRTARASPYLDHLLTRARSSDSYTKAFWAMRAGLQAMLKEEETSSSFTHFELILSLERVKIRNNTHQRAMISL